MKVTVVVVVVLVACLAATDGRVGARPSDRVEVVPADATANLPLVPAPRTQLGSDTRVLTAAMIARLADAGRLSLDDRVGHLLPWYRQDTGQRLTVRHLLAHTSGLPDDPALAEAALSPGAGTRAVVLACCSGDLQWEPGTRMQYGNAGYVLLGAIIEQVTGKTYSQAMRELVLTPAVVPDDDAT